MSLSNNIVQSLLESDSYWTPEEVIASLKSGFLNKKLKSAGVVVTRVDAKEDPNPDHYHFSGGTQARTAIIIVMSIRTPQFEQLRPLKITCFKFDGQDNWQFSVPDDDIMSILNSPKPIEPYDPFDL